MLTECSVFLGSYTYISIPVDPLLFHIIKSVCLKSACLCYGGCDIFFPNTTSTFLSLMFQLVLVPVFLFFFWHAKTKDLNFYLLLQSAENCFHWFSLFYLACMCLYRVAILTFIISSYLYLSARL